MKLHQKETSETQSDAQPQLSYIKRQQTKKHRETQNKYKEMQKKEAK